MEDEEKQEERQRKGQLRVDLVKEGDDVGEGSSHSGDDVIHVRQVQARQVLARQEVKTWSGMSWMFPHRN